jgi:endoglycosylceramidase
VDPEGRTRFFHGVNVVYKVPPYYPRLDGFDPQLSLCEKDLQDLERWGFNAIRLHTSWEGTAIEEGSFNDTYVDTLRSIVDSLEKHGIYAIMDMHQDVISPYLCGEGMPDWLVKKILGGLEFPQPVAPHIDVDPNTGYPLLEECLKREFALYYLTDAVGIVFQKLYENVNGVQDHFVDVWKHIVPKFADSRNVLGYELLNEPYFGDIYAHPSLLKSGETDKKYLQPMYERLHKEIRQIDDEHMIFYEPGKDEHNVMNVVWYGEVSDVCLSVRVCMYVCQLLLIFFRWDLLMDLAGQNTMTVKC